MKARIIATAPRPVSPGPPHPLCGWRSNGWKTGRCRPTRSSPRTSCPATPPASGTSAGPATAASRASPPTSAWTRARRSSSRSTTRRRRPTTSTSTAWATTAAWAPARWPPSPRRRRCGRSSPTRSRTPPPGWWTAATGRCPPRGPSRRPPPPASTSPSRSADDTGGASHIVFVVRDDDGDSDLLFQTSDTTWQAYNNYGGKSLYDVNSTNGDRAYKVSYNRPFLTRATAGGMGTSNWVFWGEYPMVRWLEANGYNVSYFTDVDTARRGAEILEHKVFLSVGHDEYWSGEHAGQRRGGPRRRRQPGLLQRQRDVLEDPLGDQHRRLGHPVPHPGLLQGVGGRRRRRPDQHLDRPVARHAARAGGRHRPARAAPDRDKSSRSTAAPAATSAPPSRCPRRTASCASGATPASPPSPRARPPPWPTARSATSGTRTWTTATGPPG